MKRLALTITSIAALTSALAVAQDSPESLLPPGFERPARPSRGTPSPVARPAAPAAQTNDSPAAISSPVVQAIPGPARGHAASAQAVGGGVPSQKPAPTLRELEAMSPEQLDQLLGLRPKFDIPPAARRSMKQIGILALDEGGMPAGSFVEQNPGFVRTMMAGNKGQLVSRWGHILLRRALVSRLSGPKTMAPAEFVALRAALLVRMGEGEAARSLVQDVDAANYTPELTQAALDAYVATADLTGICPAVAIQGGARKDAEWQIAQGICSAYSGSGASGLAQIEKVGKRGDWPAIDLLLAQKYAGAAGKGRRAVTIEWDRVDGMNPWRYALTIATGLEPPAGLMKGAGWRYDAITATAPMLGLPSRAAAADRAGASGVLSSDAMVDLYSQIYAQQDISGAPQARAGKLREAYLANDPANRMAAIQALWTDTTTPDQRYGRQVLTAYAAARLPVSAVSDADMAALIASMLSAGLDSNALRWAGDAAIGSQSWALLALAAPTRASPVDGGALNSFYGNDDSEQYRKSAFLLAGLAGLERVDGATTTSFADKLGIDLSKQTRWTQAIDSAANANNAALVSVIAGLGMQGDGWGKMTPRYLFHIVSALHRVGLDPEARMIAAEAVARG